MTKCQFKSYSVRTKILPFFSHISISAPLRSPLPFPTLIHTNKIG